MARSQRKKTTKAPGRRARAASRSKPTKRSVRRPAARRAKPNRAKAAPAPKRAPAAKKTAAKKKTAKAKKRPGPTRPRGAASSGLSEPLDARGLGAEAGGQSGDTEGLSRAELADSESVEELIEEGQAFEAGIIEGIENAPDADQGEVRTREVPEDDVPQEYLDED